MPRNEIVAQFLKGAVIVYRCLGPEGGMIRARYYKGQWQTRHEAERRVHSTKMDQYLAAHRVPSDARLLGAVA